MKITTYARYKWDGKEYVPIEEDSFEYTGPVSLAMPFGGSGDYGGWDDPSGGGGDDDFGGWNSVIEALEEKAREESFIDSLMGIVKGMPMRFAKQTGRVMTDLEADEMVDSLKTARVTGSMAGVIPAMMAGLPPSLGWKGGGKIAEGIYSRFGDPVAATVRNTKTPTDFSFATANQGPNDNQRPQDILNSIFANKGNIDINQFINSLLNRG